MSDLRSVIDTALRTAAEAQGLAPEQIDALVAAVWAAIQARLGGETVYIHAAPKAERNAAIVAAWRGGRFLAEIARDFDLSESRIRQIIAANRKPAP
ncbi:Mor transcription activator family protein [Halochromatium glycolicum]|nr:Mor transcription activator family protein [Halochromatium glycolicum]